MYDFVDRGGRAARVAARGHRAGRARVRAAPPAAPWKVWYLAPNFRPNDRRPGRYRQHWQLGVEVIGVEDPGVDVEVIELLRGFYRDLGLRDSSALLVNSMGDGREPDARTGRCCSSTGATTSDLLGDEMERAETNPLRILDSKRADWVGHARARTAARRVPDADASAEQFAAGARGLAGARHPVRDRTPARARASTTTRARRSSSQATRSTPRRTRSAAAAATTGWPRRWADPPTPSIGFGIGIERAAARVRRRGCVRRARARGRRVRRRRASAAPRGWC